MKHRKQTHYAELNVYRNEYDDGTITYQVIDGFDEYAEAESIIMAVDNAIQQIRARETMLRVDKS